jgi:histone acetyltransferase (RNA polymerase elongator complex component)
MAGLPGDSAGRFLESVRKAIDLRPSFVRLYPTLVLEGTQLAEWYRAGVYRPLSIGDAVEWCVPALDALHGAGIPTARMGLHATPELDAPGVLLAGPHHPAFGHMVKAGWWRKRVDESLKEMRESLQAAGEATDRKTLTIFVSGNSVSEVVGHRRANVRYWEERNRFEAVRVVACPDWEKGRFECSVGRGVSIGTDGSRRRRKGGRSGIVRSSETER